MDYKYIPIDRDKTSIGFASLLNSPGNICCGYTLEGSHEDPSNAYPQQMISYRIKKQMTF